MSNPNPAATRRRCRPPSTDRALKRVLAEIQSGLQHGYFEFGLTCEVIGRGQRRLQLRAGKNYQFVIPAEECESTEQTGDLQDEGAEKPPS